MEVMATPVEQKRQLVSISMARSILSSTGNSAGMNCQKMPAVRAYPATNIGRLTASVRRQDQSTYLRM